MIVKSEGNVIYLSGALGANHWQTIKALAKLLFKQYPKGLILDCSQVTTANLAGLETFHEAVVHFANPFKRAETHIVLCGVPAPMHEAIMQHPKLAVELVLASTHSEAHEKLGTNDRASYQGWVHSMASAVAAESPAVLTPEDSGPAPTPERGLIVKARGDVISLIGALNSNHWQTIKAAAKLLVRQQRLGIILDCEQLVSISPEGSHTFRDAVGYYHNSVNKTQARIIVCGLSPALREEICKQPGVRSSLATASSIAEARMSLKLESWNRPAEEPDRASIVVPLLSAQGIESACSQAVLIAGQRKLPIYLVYLLEVPMAQHLDAPLPSLEEKAERELAQAVRVLSEQGCQVSRHIKRTRDRAEGLTEVVDALHADFLVMGLTRKEHRDFGASLVNELLTHSKSDIIVTYANATTSTSTVSRMSAEVTQDIQAVPSAS